MGNIKKIHNEIKTDQVRDALIRSLLNSLIAVFVALIVLTFIPNNPYYSQIYSGTLVIVFLLTWIFSYLLHVKKISIKVVEQKIPEFDQIYPTALEYDAVQTEPAAALRDKFEKVASNSSTIPLMNTKAYNIKLFIALILLIIIAFLPLIDTRAIPADKFMDFISQFISDKQTLIAERVQLKSGDDILGDENVFAPGKNDIPVTIDLSTGGGNFENPTTWENQLSANSRNYFGVVANLDSPAIEELPAEFEVAKAYNLKIREMR
jgi:hypothetical protein